MRGLLSTMGQGSGSREWTCKCRGNECMWGGCQGTERVRSSVRGPFVASELLSVDPRGGEAL